MGEVLRRVIGVKGLVVRGARLEPRGIVVEVRPRQRRPRCSECGRPGPGYDTREERLWRHLSLGRTVFWLRYAPRRVECREHGARVEKVPWAAHDSAFTFEFEEMTAWLAQQMNKTATSRLMGINWRTVGTIIQRVVKARLDKDRLEDLYIIGVDELSFRRHHEYVTVVVDH
jgi:transposase